MSRYIQADRETPYLLPPSVDEWLPAKHLARFIVEIIEPLDLRRLTQGYALRGSAAHHPAVLLALLVYGYATGIFSSRKLERATYDAVAFRYLAANTHPDHDTLANFRKRFLPELEDLFVQVLSLAQAMKLVRLGHIALDGSKLKANASKHKALSHSHLEKLEAQWREEVQTLLAKAEATDLEELPDGLDLPAELARREARLNALAEAKAEIEARAQARFEAEQREYQAKVARREAHRQAGKTPRGKEPQPPEAGPREQDQVNLTDEEPRIMPVSGGGFDQAYNVQSCLDRKIEPLIALGREAHHRPLDQRFGPDAPEPDTDDLVAWMAWRLKTKAGRALYAKRKATVEPVFGIIKQVMGFRQFSLRGLAAVTGEWTLVTLAFNLKRMQVLRFA